MPILTRRKSLPICASVERRPLWPAVPPPVFTFTLNGARSSSSWKTVTSPASFLKKSIAARTERPLSFMKVAGFSSRMRCPPIRPCWAQPEKLFLGGSKLCTSAMASTAMKPTLWRCIAYCAPGLPRPTQICTGANSPQSSSWTEAGWPGTSTGGLPNKEPSQRNKDLSFARLFAGFFAFLADQRHVGGNRRLGFGSGVRGFELDARGGDDGRNREVAVGDRALRALGQGDLADVQRIADVHAGEADHDLFRDLGRIADQLKVVADLVAHAA